MKSGTTIGNKDTGETLTMLTSEEDSGGALQYYRVNLPAYRPSPPLHYHVAFTETFTCVEGTLDMYLGRNRGHVRLHVGENVRADIGQPHTFSNTSSSPCIMTVETRPAGGVVKAFQLAYGSANEGKANKDGLPRNLLIRLLFIEISQGYLPQIPLGLQRFILTLTTIVSRLTGMERRIQQYLTD
jgi:mannose-6-phosphate isomerase-like protein (cupin superfamily)